MACPKCGSENLWEDHIYFGCNGCGYCNVPILDKSGHFDKIAREQGPAAAEAAVRSAQSVRIVETGTGRLRGYLSNE